jgi:hypothetical protein
MSATSTDRRVFVDRVTVRVRDLERSRRSARLRWAARDHRAGVGPEPARRSGRRLRAGRSRRLRHRGRHALRPAPRRLSWLQVVRSLRSTPWRLPRAGGTTVRRGCSLITTPATTGLRPRSGWLVDEVEVGRHGAPGDDTGSGKPAARPVPEHHDIGRRECDSRHYGGPERYSQLLSRLTRFTKSLLSRGASEPRRTEESE